MDVCEMRIKLSLPVEKWKDLGDKLQSQHHTNWCCICNILVGQRKTMLLSFMCQVFCSTFNGKHRGSIVDPDLWRATHLCFCFSGEKKVTLTCCSSKIKNNGIKDELQSIEMQWLWQQLIRAAVDWIYVMTCLQGVKCLWQQFWLAGNCSFKFKFCIHASA